MKSPFYIQLHELRWITLTSLKTVNRLVVLLEFRAKFFHSAFKCTGSRDFTQEFNIYVLNWLDAVSTLPKHRLMLRTVHFALRRLPNVVRESLNNLLLSFWEKRLWTSVSSGVRLQIKETSSWKLWELRWPRCVPGSSMLCSLKEGLCGFREFVSEIF